MSDDQLNEVIETLERQRDEAVSVMDSANPNLEFDTAEEMFDELTPIEPKTYTLELEMHEYELFSLIAGLMEPMGEYTQADDMAVSTSLLIKLIKECPEHMDRMGTAITEPDAENNIRGYQ